MKKRMLIYLSIVLYIDLNFYFLKQLLEISKYTWLMFTLKNIVALG